MEPESGLFLECYQEAKTWFPGSLPDTLKELAVRLYISMAHEPNYRMDGAEFAIRCNELSVALSSINNWKGLRRGERPDNATYWKDNDNSGSS